MTDRTPPVIVDPPAPTSVRVGQTVNLTCTITGTPTPSITWFKDGRIVEGAIFQYFYIPSVRPADRGYYECEAKNSEDTVQSASVLLQIIGMTVLSCSVMDQ